MVLHENLILCIVHDMSGIRPYVHSLDISKAIDDIVRDDITETQTAFNTDSFRFRHCLDERCWCTEKILICPGSRSPLCTRTRAPFVRFACPEIQFSAHLRPDQQRMSYDHVNTAYHDVFYLLATNYQPENRNYRLHELLDLMDDGKLSVAYGGLSEVHRAHLLTEDAYESYRDREWCEGGCGGCEDNWDYIDPWLIYLIFPKYSDMVAYKERCISFLRQRAKLQSAARTIQNWWRQQIISPLNPICREKIFYILDI